jgi:hypothetical protein
MSERVNNEAKTPGPFGPGDPVVREPATDTTPLTPGIQEAASVEETTTEADKSREGPRRSKTPPIRVVPFDDSSEAAY